MEVPATRKQRLTLSMDPRMGEQMGHFRLTVGKKEVLITQVNKNICCSTVSTSLMTKASITYQSNSFKRFSMYITSFFFSYFHYDSCNNIHCSVMYLTVLMLLKCIVLIWNNP